VKTRTDAQKVFESREAARAKREIASVAHKLWLREYVDGNGGNITCRVSDEYVLCTPTLLSKADVRPSDIAMVDLQGKQVAGSRRRSSEISLHVAIMRAVPEARAVIHCHPPHATAYAITGRVPPEWLLAEPEVFIGPIGRVPYETPGTDTCAETAAAAAKHHNAILLVNHGVACWADTVTHAEWYVEILDTYCRTLMLAAQLGAPLVQIPSDRRRALLDLKKGLGLPDARYGLSDAELGGAGPARSKRHKKPGK
jgi:L-fuculose-phosphate aldolase